MANDFLVNSAHGSGLTVLAFSRDGTKLYTAGDDALVRVWDASKDASQEPKVVDEAEEGVVALNCSDDAWISASTDSNVRRYNSSDDAFAGFLTRSTGIHAVAFNPDGTKIAVASDDLDVKIVDVEDPVQITLLKGHTKGVRSVTWDPSGTILTTAGLDGTVKIWDPTSSAPTHSMDGLISAIDVNAPEAAYDSSPVWHPNGRYFVVATKTHEIVVIQSEVWTQAGSFSKGGHNGAITALCFSPNGEYLASAGEDGNIFVWSTTSRTVLFRREAASKVTIPSIRFNPKSNLLAWTDIEGSLSRWLDPIPASHPHPSKLPSLSSKSKAKQANTNLARKELDDLFADVGEDIGFDGDEADEADRMAVDGEGLIGDEYDDEFVIDDEDGDAGAVSGFKHQLHAPLDREDNGVREMVNVTKAQPAFQPGSTPFRNKKRYLAFNMIGVIECTDQETHHIINVEFHDKSLRRGYHFNDSFRYTLASLGPRGALYACPPEKNSSASGSSASAAQIHYRPYDTWASSPEWSVELNKGEVPVAICAGGAAYKKNSSDDDLGEDEEDQEAETRRGPKDAGGAGYAIVALNNGRIHIWLGTGIHMYMMTVGGEVVAMAASAEWLFIIHREGGTSLDGCQNLRYTIVTLDSYDIIKENASVPLGKGVTLKWMGFTAEEAPAIYDSQGVLHILDRFRRPTQGRWVPILDTNTLARREGKDESYWPVGLSLSEFSCIILKGREQYPGFPRPLIQELEVRMPGYQMDNPKGVSEERLIREKILITLERDALPSTADIPSSISEQELELDKVLLTLIQTACKADKLDRALDYTSRLNHLNSFDTAQTVANFYHLPGLKERMRRLKEARERAEGLDTDEDGRIIREGWGRVLEPVPRGGVAELEPPPRRDAYPRGYGGGKDYNSKHSLEFPPQPAVPRRSLATATAAAAYPASSSSLPPSSYDTRQGSPPPPRGAVGYDDSSSSFAESQDTFKVAAAAKRKHDGDDDGRVQRKRASPAPVAQRPAPPPPAKGNPFARKKAPDGTAAASSNPFARNGGAGKPLNAIKSNSFFEKVDYAEEQVSQPLKGRAGKAKGKPVVRQTTLFNLPAPPPPEKVAKGKKAGKAKETATESTRAREAPVEVKDSSPVDDESPPTRTPSPEADLVEESALTPDPEEAEDETQPASYMEEEEREGSPDWEGVGDDEDVEMGNAAEPVSASS